MLTQIQDNAVKLDGAASASGEVRVVAVGLICSQLLQGVGLNCECVCGGGTWAWSLPVLTVCSPGLQFDA